MHRKRIVATSLVMGGLVGAVISTLTWLPAHEAECLAPELCQPQQTRLDDDGYLRAVSLDVRGVVPTPEEHARMAEEGIEPLIDEWLDSEAFQQRVVRRHRALLWPNISTVGQFIHTGRNLSLATVDGGGSPAIWHITRIRFEYRGDRALGCADVPAVQGPDGRYETDERGREGYVMVRPYWAMDTEIKVCAFDAQTREMSPSGNDCRTRAGIGDPECGCGPNLRYCTTNDIRAEMLASFTADFERRIADHVARGEPYHELLTSNRGFVNGPLVHFWRYLRDMHDGVALVPAAIDVDGLPATEVDGGSLRYDQADAWTEVRLPDEHAGLLTHPVFLMRFQTNRARANRFYDAFLCTPFQPPESGLPVEDEVAQAQADVQQRPGCNYCHAILEPTAAYWGRWTQQGAAYLDPVDFPEFRDECRDCALGFESCSDTCRLNYVTRALSPEEEPNLGRLRAFEFLREEHRRNVELGPAALVHRGLADGRFTSCAVDNTAEWLLGRALRAEEDAWGRSLTDRFLADNFQYRELVRAVVTSETYRRAL